MINEKILTILSNPKNVGQMRDADGIGKVKGQECRDFSKLFVKFENRVVSETKFQTYGGPVSIAAVSVVSELIKGKTIEQMLEITVADVMKELGKLSEDQKACVKNAVDLIPSCVASYYRKQEKKGSYADQNSAKEEKKPAKKETEQKAKEKKQEVENNSKEEQEQNNLDEMDIFSEIDEITAKISEAVKKMKKK